MLSVMQRYVQLSLDQDLDDSSLEIYDFDETLEENLPYMVQCVEEKVMCVSVWKKKLISKKIQHRYKNIDRIAW